ncbi:MAG: sporulation protein YqfD [Bacilli bacterium]|nr:sporulation protein YqfD [Bacilli bacterium]
MKNQLNIKVTNVKPIDFVKFLVEKEIYYTNYKYINNEIFIKIDYKNYKKIRKFCGKKNIKIINFHGLIKLKKDFYKEYIFLLSFIFSILLIYFLSNITFNIKIITGNKKLSDKLYMELEEYGIKKYSFVKSYDEINKIKEKILNNNSDSLEWIEITKEGTKYIINITERVKNAEKGIINSRNLVSSKDALILKIISRNGMPVKSVNDYVKKGEIIISGNIVRGEEIVGTTYADADVYGEVWYTSVVDVPFYYKEYTPTGKEINHYYLDFPSFKLTLLGYYKNNNVISEKEILIDKPYLFFKLIKEKKRVYEYKEYKVNEEEALKEAIKRATKSIEVLLKDDEYIIDKKVLKNTVFSSKISVEVFFRVYENIVDYENIENTLENNIEG